MGGSLLRPLAGDLWVAEQPLRFAGVELGARMTVVRLPGGRLLLHSPIARSPELAVEVERLGAPAVVVAPNRLHHLHVQEWLAAYPASRLFVAPGLETKRRDLQPNAVLGDDPPAEWREVLDQALLAGAPFTSEVVLFHRASATLLVSDLLFNVGAASPPLTRLAFRLAGAYGRPATTPLERLLVRDKDAFRRSLAKILAWPIERIVLAHGAVVESGGRAALAAAYAWVLGGEASAGASASPTP
jgi:hypothetical protein